MLQALVSFTQVQSDSACFWAPPLTLPLLLWNSGKNVFCIPMYQPTAAGEFMSVGLSLTNEERQIGMKYFTPLSPCT